MYGKECESVVECDRYGGGDLYCRFEQERGYCDCHVDMNYNYDLGQCVSCKRI